MKKFLLLLVTFGILMAISPPSKSAGVLTNIAYTKSNTKVYITFTKPDSIKYVNVYGTSKTGGDSTQLPLMGLYYTKSPIVLNIQDMGASDTLYVKLRSYTAGKTFADSSFMFKIATPGFTPLVFCDAGTNLTSLLGNIGANLSWTSNSVAGTRDTVHWRVTWPISGTDSTHTTTTHEYKTTRLVKGATYTWYVVTLCNGVAIRSKDAYFSVPK